MKVLRWKDLNSHEKVLWRKHGSNGCGSKGAWIKAPDFVFKADCDRHDFGYWRGGDKAMRLAVDRGFYQGMLQDAGSSWWLRLVAWVYYRAVRYGGRKSWPRHLQGRRQFDAWIDEVTLDLYLESPNGGG